MWGIVVGILSDSQLGVSGPAAGLAVIVLTDLLSGIILGLFVALFYILLNNYNKPFLFDSSVHMQDDRIHLKLAEDVTFINKASIQRTLNKIPSGVSVTIDGSNTINLNHDVYEIIYDFKKGGQYKNIQVQLIEVKSQVINNQLHEIEPAIEEQKLRLLAANE